MQINTRGGPAEMIEHLEVDGFSQLDLVLIKSGLEFQVIELASGGLMGMGMTRDESIENMKESFQKRNKSVNEFVAILFDRLTTKYLTPDAKPIKQLNHSDKLQDWLNRKELAYNEIPLLYSDEEKQRMLEMKKLAESRGKIIYARQLEAAMNIRSGEKRLKLNFDFMMDRILEDDEPILEKPINDKVWISKVSVQMRRTRALSKCRNKYEAKRKAFEGDLFYKDLFEKWQKEYDEAQRIINERYDGIEKYEAEIIASGKAVYEL